jgi:hypothetical protein
VKFTFQAEVIADVGREFGNEMVARKGPGSSAGGRRGSGEHER